MRRPDLKDRITRCEKCGCTEFHEAQFRQYGRAYSSGIGGDLSAASYPVTVTICLCGHPVPTAVPLSIPAEMRASFNDSFARAVERRDQTDPDLIEERLSKSFITRDQFERHEEELRNLAKAIDTCQREKQDESRALHQPSHDGDAADAGGHSAERGLPL